MVNKGFLDKCINFLRDIIINIIVEFVLKYPKIGIFIALLFIVLMCIKEITTGLTLLSAYVVVAIIYYIVLRCKTKQEYNNFINNYISNIRLPSEYIKRIEKATSEMQMTNIREGIFFLNCLVFSILKGNINDFSTSFSRKKTDQLKIDLFFQNTKKNRESIKIKVLMNGELKRWEESEDDCTSFAFDLEPQQTRKIDVFYDNRLFNQLNYGKNFLTIFANGRKIVDIYIFILDKN